MSLAHIVVCRAGANAIAELIALRRPALLIPLSTESSRGDQTHNAEAFCTLGGGLMISNESLTTQRLEELIEKLEAHHDQHLLALEGAAAKDSAQQILGLIQDRV